MTDRISTNMKFKTPKGGLDYGDLLWNELEYFREYYRKQIKKTNSRNRKRADMPQRKKQASGEKGVDETKHN